MSVTFGVAPRLANHMCGSAAVLNILFSLSSGYNEKAPSAGC